MTDIRLEESNEPPQDDKPPSICGITSNRVSCLPSNRLSVRFREMGFIHHIVSPMPGIRLRDDSILLDSYG